MARILILEDAEDFGSLIVTALEDAGHEAETHPTLSEALEAYAARPADIVLCDIFLGHAGRVTGTTGMDAIVSFRKMTGPDGKPPQVIAMSGAYSIHGRDSMLEAARALGAAEALAKPFLPEELMAAIDRAVAAQGVQ